MPTHLDGRLHIHTQFLIAIGSVASNLGWEIGDTIELTVEDGVIFIERMEPGSQELGEQWMARLEHGTKRCKKCGETKPLSEFYMQAASRGGYRSNCKQCAANRQREGRRKRRGTEGKTHTPRQEYWAPTFKAVSKKLTIHRGQHVSVEKEASIPRPTPSQVGVPPGMKRCTKCKAIKPPSEFTKNKKAYDGLAAHCKNCVAAAARERSRRKAHAEGRAYKPRTGRTSELLEKHRAARLAVKEAKVLARQEKMLQDFKKSVAELGEIGLRNSVLNNQLNIEKIIKLHGDVSWLPPQQYQNMARAGLLDVKFENGRPVYFLSDRVLPVLTEIQAVVGVGWDGEPILE